MLEIGLDGYDSICGSYSLERIRSKEGDLLFLSENNYHDVFYTSIMYPVPRMLIIQWRRSRHSQFASGIHISC